MTRVQAIYENGIFRPIEPVAIDDGTQVQLTVEEGEPSEAPGSIVSALEEIAKLPVEGASDGFSGADHDRVLYKE